MKSINKQTTTLESFIKKISESMNIEQDVYFHALIESHLQIEKQQRLEAYSDGMINGITNNGMDSYQYYKERYEKQKILTKIK